MHLDEFQAREAELDRWTAAGAVDGQPAPPPLERGPDHLFALAEVRAMSTAEFAINEAAILRQLPTLGAARADERRQARERAGRGIGAGTS